MARRAAPNYVFAAPLNEALAGSIPARRAREDSVMSMQTQQIVVEDAVAGDAESTPARRRRRRRVEPKRSRKRPSRAYTCVTGGLLLLS